jgi:hypothetical protein
MIFDEPRRALRVSDRACSHRHTRGDRVHRGKQRDDSDRRPSRLSASFGASNESTTPVVQAGWCLLPELSCCDRRRSSTMSFSSRDFRLRNGRIVGRHLGQYVVRDFQLCRRAHGSNSAYGLHVFDDRRGREPRRWARGEFRKPPNRNPYLRYSLRERWRVSRQRPAPRRDGMRLTTGASTLEPRCEAEASRAEGV